MEPTEKAPHDLEWPSLVGQLAEFTHSRAGRERAEALVPAGTLEGARILCRRTAEAMALAQDDQRIPFRGLPEVREVLARLGREGDATAFELHGVRSLLLCAQELRRWAHARRGTHPSLAEALQSEGSLDALHGALDHALEGDGTLADRASPDLGALRRKVQDTRARLVTRLEEFMARYAVVLQDRYHTVRDGRYVIPVRSDSHLDVPGIVHGSSASGATLFIEPRPVVPLGNQLKVHEADVAREEARVLAQLSERVRGALDAVLAAHEACVTADVLGATVRLGEALEATALAPEAEPVLELQRVRHPLLVLAGGAVVANDLALRSGRVLVVSGPNAGGKTVALKTLGLAALMVRAGLPVPAQEGSRVGWFEPIECDVGDDQSLSKNLSTVSAHVTHLAAVLGRVRRGALVLLDELAGGTDPEEGAALAASVLEALASAGAAVAVTTHYELLKTLAVRDERFSNASVGFALETMAPTFTVTLGIPGASSALSVARRFGIPEAVVHRARALLPEHVGSREEVLRRLQDEERAARVARSAAEDEARNIARLRAELETERNALRAREQAKLSREGAELFAALRKAREELREAQAKLKRRRLEEQEVKDAEAAVDAVAAELSHGGSLGRALGPKGTDGPSRRALREDEVRPGMKVFVPRLGATVDVLERGPRDQLRVAAGALKLSVALDEVQVDEAPEAPRDRRGTTALPYDAAGDAVRPLRTESNTCDVRGLRVDDALSLVDAFLDRVYGEGNSAGFVLHGHGTGALKAAVREHLRGSAYITRSRAADPEDGGDAFTVFWLKG
jgi:DNA mismatch repair protein MutS2